MQSWVLTFDRRARQHHSRMCEIYKKFIARYRARAPLYRDPETIEKKCEDDYSHDKDVECGHAEESFEIEQFAAFTHQEMVKMYRNNRRIRLEKRSSSWLGYALTITLFLGSFTSAIGASEIIPSVPKPTACPSSKLCANITYLFIYTISTTILYYLNRDDTQQDFWMLTLGLVPALPLGAVLGASFEETLLRILPWTILFALCLSRLLRRARSLWICSRETE
jgi:hypothetical protein